jgi:glycosyltransferase involved in cell wall biosynthesis
MLNPENRIKGLLYKTVHTLSDTILLYSRNETKYISKKHHNKVFVANNTINFKTIPTIIESKEELKIKYKIPFKKVLLFVGRIQKRKRLDILVDYFSTLDHSDYGLVIVGKNIPEELFEKIKYSKNIIYFGEVYKDIDDFFKLSDIFCIPGTNGLGINHAMFWGLPVLTLNVKHNPEIFYLKNGINGYILDTPIDLFDKIKELFENEKEQKRLSINAYKIIREEASIEVMAKGFIDSLNYLKRKKE